MRKKVTRRQNNAKFCLVCGVDNQGGLHADFYELEDGTLACLVTVRSYHQSYPGRVHGGISTALLDETIGRAVNITEPETWGVTVEMQTRFLKPVPYDVPLVVLGAVTKNSRRLYNGEGKLLLPDGTAAVTATARYMKMPLSAISDLDEGEGVWAPSPSDPGPREIEIPGTE